VLFGLDAGVFKNTIMKTVSFFGRYLMVMCHVRLAFLFNFFRLIFKPQYEFFSIFKTYCLFLFSFKIMNKIKIDNIKRMHVYIYYSILIIILRETKNKKIINIE
jgi:hypothetical protein